MKFAKYFALLAVIASMLSLSAFAKDSHSGKFTLSNTVQVGSTQLAPGDYKAEWNGPANDVKVDITQHGKTVATTEGKIKDLQKPATDTAILTKTLDNDVQKLNEIQFSNRTEALVLGGE